MKTSRTFLTTVLCVLAVCGPAIASPPAVASRPAARKLPPAEPLLKVIPAGTMGYVVLHNVKTAADDVDKFLKQIGAADMLKDDMPDGILKAVLKEADLGEGFNPGGGLAVALLDPNAFGIDLIKLMKSAMPGAAASQPATAAGPAPKLPIVFFIPGTGVKEVLGRFNPQAADPYMKLNIGGEELFAAPLGSYILLSPNPKALEAVAAATQKADDELKGAAATIVRNSSVAMRLNLKALYPVIQKGVKALDLLTSANDEGLVDAMPAGEVYKSFKPMVGPYLLALSQMDDMVMGLRIAETGVVASVATNYRSDSPVAKMWASYKAPDKPLMDSLTGASYVMALSANSAATHGGTASPEAIAQNIEGLMDNPALAGLPREQREKLLALLKKASEEFTDCGFVMNGTPATAKGIMSFSLLLKCKDSKKAKALLADGTDLLNEIIKTAAAGNADAEGVKVSYEKDVDKVDDLSADSIVLKLPGAQDSAVSMMLDQVFGETSVAPLVAAPDASTILITFGGGKDTLSFALRAAAGKEDKDLRILAQKETAEAMKFMPRNPCFLLFFNAANCFDMVTAGIKKFSGGGAEAIPFSITCKTPVAVGVGVDGSATVATFYVPTSLVKELIGMYFASYREGLKPQPAKPVPGGEEF